MSRALENVRQNLREFNVLAYGAVPSTDTDSTTAIQACIDACEAAGGGTVFFPVGSYKVTATLTCTVPITLKGANCRAVILQVNHTAGPAITFGDYFSGIDNIAVQGSSARLAAENVADVGVKFVKSGTRAMFSNFVRNCLISNHGSHGIETDSVQFFVVDDSRILDNGGHAIYLDATTVDDDNIRSGITEIKNTQTYNNRGHSICAGVNNYVFRLTLDNVDNGPSALTADIRESAYCCHLIAENLIVRNCAFSGHTDTDPRVMTVGGLYVNGISPLIENNRFIDVLDTAVELGADSDGARILDNHITGNVQTALDPAYVVASGCTGVYARAGRPANHTSIMTPAPANSGNRSEWYGISPQGHKSALQADTIADDDVKQYTFTAVTYGVLILAANSGTGGTPVIVAFRVGDGSAYCILLAGNAADVTVGTGALTGTTGTDARLNISVSTTANILYVENRQGASYAWMPSFMSLSGGELVLS